MALDHGAWIWVLMKDYAAFLTFKKGRVDNDILEMVGVVVLNLLEREITEVGQLVLLALPGDNLDEQESEEEDDKRDCKHDEEMLEDGVLCEKFFVHIRNNVTR